MEQKDQQKPGQSGERPDQKHEYGQGQLGPKDKQTKGPGKRGER
jgi:hypothetical protein